MIIEIDEKTAIVTSIKLPDGSVTTFGAAGAQTIPPSKKSEEQILADAVYLMNRAARRYHGYHD